MARSFFERQTSKLNVRRKPGSDSFFDDPFEGLGGGKKDRKARDAAKAATDKVEAIRLEEEARNTAINAPWVASGNQANTQLNTETFDPGEQAPIADYVNPTFDFQADPGFAYRLKEAQDSIENSASARGGAFSAGTLADLAGRTGEMASEEYGNAFNRFAGDRQFSYGQYSDKVNQGNNLYAQKRQRLTDRFDQLSSIANRGVNAGNQQQSVYNTSATGRADNVIGLANANQAIEQNRANNNAAIITGGLEAIGTIGGAMIGGPTGAKGGNTLGNLAGSTLQKGR